MEKLGNPLKSCKPACKEFNPQLSPSLLFLLRHREPTVTLNGYIAGQSRPPHLLPDIGDFSKLNPKRQVVWS